MQILLLFVDGVGVGDNDPNINPCAWPGFRFFNVFKTDPVPKSIGMDGIGFGIDARLDVAGIPQSATGQTTILTGINAARILGRHLNGFPNEKLRTVLKEHSIFNYFNHNGYRAAFINSYRPPFFDYDPYQIIRKLSVTSVANLYANLKFFGLDDLRAEKSIYQEFTNTELKERGFDVPIFTPARAGTILAQASQNYDFCLFEYFQTDIAGHAQEPQRAIREIAKLEEFLSALLIRINWDNQMVLLVSDHGNIEDLGTKSHTGNSALALVWGAYKDQVFQNLKSILEVTPTIKYLKFMN